MHCVVYMASDASPKPPTSLSMCVWYKSPAILHDMIVWCVVVMGDSCFVCVWAFVVNDDRHIVFVTFNYYSLLQFVYW